MSQKKPSDRVEERRSPENVGRRSYDIDNSLEEVQLLKRAVPVELILHDGSHLTGSVYVSSSLALHNLFTALPDFFHLYRDAPDYYLVNKTYVALCKIQRDEGMMPGQAENP